MNTFLIESEGTKSLKNSHLRLLTVALWIGLAWAVWVWGSSSLLFSSAEQRAVAHLNQQTLLHSEVDEKGTVVEFKANTASMTDELAVSLLQFPHLRRLHLGRSGITDEALTQIGQLTELEELYLDGTQITDQGLSKLHALSGLQELSLADCPISDQGLESVAQLTQLRLLNLTHTRITDAGLPQLRSLSQLETLYLKGVNLEGTGLLELQQWTAMKKLDLSENPLSQGVIPVFAHFGQLEHLYLTDCPVGDEFVTELIPVLVRSAPSLRSLSLAQLRLTNNATEPLKKLAELKELAVVQLQGTAISKAEFMKMATAVPDVNFSVGYSESE